MGNARAVGREGLRKPSGAKWGRPVSLEGRTRVASELQQRDGVGARPKNANVCCVDRAGTLHTVDDTVDELANTLAATLTVGSPVDVKGTLVPVRVRPSRAIAAASGIDLGTTIGTGGMGVVREGVQRSLERVVAVKTLRDELRGHTEPAAELLREARLTGTLEHPNVVPVHDVGVDEHGAPMIVLKRISGITWSELIRDADRVRELAPSGDLLEWNLRTLMQVASAIHFAHSRGVIHRDLKPDNVMIGEFGETYVVDWGIAVPLEDLKAGATASSPAGTPCYMAPEMLGQDGPPPPSVATDVYLLGGVLFEIVSGHPPHDGTGLVDVLRKILTVDPEPPADAPEELAAILRPAPPGRSRRLSRPTALGFPMRQVQERFG